MKMIKEAYAYLFLILILVRPSFAMEDEEPCNKRKRDPQEKIECTDLRANKTQKTIASSDVGTTFSPDQEQVEDFQTSTQVTDEILPDELWIAIFQWLPKKDLSTAGRCSKRFYDLGVQAFNIFHWEFSWEDGPTKGQHDSHRVPLKEILHSHNFKKGIEFYLNCVRSLPPNNGTRLSDEDAATSLKFCKSVEPHSLADKLLTAAYQDLLFPGLTNRFTKCLKKNQVALSMKAERGNVAACDFLGHMHSLSEPFMQTFFSAARATFFSGLAIKYAPSKKIGFLVSPGLSYGPAQRICGYIYSESDDYRTVLMHPHATFTELQKIEGSVTFYTGARLDYHGLNKVRRKLVNDPRFSEQDVNRRLQLLRNFLSSLNGECFQLSFNDVKRDRLNQEKLFWEQCVLTKYQFTMEDVLEAWDSIESGKLDRPHLIRSGQSNEDSITYIKTALENEGLLALPPEMQLKKLRELAGYIITRQIRSHEIVGFLYETIVSYENSNLMDRVNLVLWLSKKPDRENYNQRLKLFTQIAHDPKFSSLPSRERSFFFEISHAFCLKNITQSEEQTEEDTLALLRDLGFKIWKEAFSKPDRPNLGFGDFSYFYAAAFRDQPHPEERELLELALNHPIFDKDWRYVDKSELLFLLDRAISLQTQAGNHSRVDELKLMYAKCRVSSSREEEEEDED